MKTIWQTLIDYSVATLTHVECLLDECHAKALVRREERRNAEYPNG